LAIIGLTDRGAALPRLGILRKGAPKPNENRPGADLRTHFRFECDDAAAAGDFQRAYGEKPNHIRIMFYYPTTAENFETWQEHHSAGALKHRCDGQVCVLSLQSDGTYTHDRLPCPSIELKSQNPNIDKKHLCRPIGRLKIVIPELQRMAYILVPTTSINDILELQSNLEAAEALRGDLRGIPFILSRRPRKVSTPTENGGRARREKWLLSIEPAPDWVKLQLTAMERAALPSVDVKQLAPPPMVDVDTGEIFDDEEPTEEAPPTVELSGIVDDYEARYNGGGALYVKFKIDEKTIIVAEPLSSEWMERLDNGVTATVRGAWAQKPNSSMTFVQAQEIEVPNPAPTADYSEEWDEIDRAADTRRGRPLEESLL
jgi:hypothetical protein